MLDSASAASKFTKLVEIMKRLRAENGCPWDREQTYLTLRRYILEESYELIEAIENDDIANMREECGDLMLQVVFVSCIAEERGDFDICDAIDGLTAKLIRRHPHVFGEVTAETSEEVLKNWEQIKVAERKERKSDSSVLAGIPRGLPALLRAYRIQERAAKVGFDWEKGDITPVMNKVDEEVSELKEAIANKDLNNISEELGDLLFAVVNLSRHLDNDPESVLHMACMKFASRFRDIESSVADSKRAWNEFSLEELDLLWQKAKCKENK